MLKILKTLKWVRPVGVRERETGCLCARVCVCLCVCVCVRERERERKDRFESMHPKIELSASQKYFTTREYFPFNFFVPKRGSRVEYVLLQNLSCHKLITFIIIKVNTLGRKFFLDKGRRCCGCL